MKTRPIVILFLLTIVFAITGFTMIHFISREDPSPEGQAEEFIKEWKKVDSLSEQGLPQSALEIVSDIYSRAQSTHNSPQFVKSLLYRMSLRSDYQEDFMDSVISDTRQEILQADFPVRQILYSIQSELYWRYYTMNRHQILGRTATTGFQKDDIRTWDLQAFITEIISSYEKSLEEKENLRQIPLKEYDAILVVAKDSKKYRPTLYDFLAHRAVDFFMNEETGLTEPIYKFTIDSPDHFAPAEAFTKLDITTRDTLSRTFYALRLLLDIERFHLHDDLPEALIDAELKRLNFVHQEAVLENKDTLYLEALLKMREDHRDHPASAEITFWLANAYYEQGALYDPLKSDDFKWVVKEAHDLCLEALQNFPESEGARSCQSLMEKIRTKEISLTTDYATYQGSPFPALVRYKNTEAAYLRIIRMDPEKDREIRELGREDTPLVAYLKEPVLREWDLKLPDDGDFQSHSVEISLPVLPPGYYILMLSPNPTFAFRSEPVAYTSFWITDISYISRGDGKGSYDIYVLHRDKGTPLADVTVTAYNRDYDYQARKSRLVEWQRFTTDVQGLVEIPAPSRGDRSRALILDFRKDGDRLLTDTYFYLQFHPDKEKEKKPRTFFFTDRAIYRPGQTVYFKGIMIGSDGRENEILAKHPTEVTFYDVNHQKIASLSLVTNEYGSFNGSFSAPSGVLTGAMTIRNESGSVTVQVEEYKRPKFEVVFEPVKGVYKLNEQVSVTGVAKSYAGVGLDQAQVRYRVVRSAIFPYPLWWRGWFPPAPEMEIANGLLTTGDTGHFTITFKAVPDLSLDKKYKPVFHYRIYADVTDLNGETQASSNLVAVGYNAMLVDADIPVQLDKAGKASFILRTTNLNGQPEPARVKVGIYKLKEPGRIFRERQWPRPDKFIMSQKEFYDLFPYDIYNDEDNVETWEKETTILEREHQTPADSLIPLEGLSGWKSGSYLITLSTVDAFGEKIEVKKYTTVFSKQDKKVPSRNLHWYTALKASGEPGEKASLLLGSAEKDVRVIREVIHENKTVSREWTRLNDQQRSFEVPIKEEYRGNFQVLSAYVRHNRSFQDIQLITVPYTNKQLVISFETFRNKLLPGQDEEWRIRIKDKKGDQVAAEMVASLYDASLDAFVPHSWSFDIFRASYGTSGWNVKNAFGTRSSDSYTSAPYMDVQPVIREYDALNWFGFEAWSRYYMPMLKGVAARAAGVNAIEEDVLMSVVTGQAQEVRESDEGTVPPAPVPEERPAPAGGLQIRRDFRETAFFYPTLQTDSEGGVIIRFTVPEALTRWKILGFAHTKELQNGLVTNELVTQKDLMVLPNAPRFFREGDQMVFNAKINNLSDTPLTGKATLEILDAITMHPVDMLQSSGVKEVNFTVDAGKSTVAGWPLAIPYEGVEAVTYRVVATAGNFSDGEEATLPVLTNRMLVTETMPLPIKGNQTRQFRFVKLLESGNSTTLKNHRLTLEYTSNPAWNAIQALPYLMEYPYECSEQLFSRYYANTLAGHIATSNPKIKRVFDAWKNYTPDALLSNLEKNQELKALILEETPWVLNAQNETERKHRVALLFDLNRMASEQQAALKKLQEMQLPNGGWPWFREMQDNRYITQHIVAGFGHLNKLKVQDMVAHDQVWQMIRKAVLYLDDRMREDYEYIRKHYPDKMDEQHIGYTQIHYLYARSYYNTFNFTVEMDGKNKEAFDYFMGQAKKYWVKQNNYMQGMIGLALHRYGEKEIPANIIKSLKERALSSEEMGMYWRGDAGYFWHQAPIETQALLIELFDEVANDQKAVEEMKVWLLKQKQTQDWKTTKATVEAVYALLLRGTDLLASDELVQVKLGNTGVDPKKMEDVKVEAGTGYFKTAWTGKEITPEMGYITVTKPDAGIAWGGIYWQYFEDLDKITPHETPLKLEKKLFIERNTPTGPVMESIAGDGSNVKVGDRIKVRIEIRVDRDMEYVHLKDMRAAAFEPVNVLSGYRYQGGLGYYESTRDASTNFFIGYLPKGAYVFEYPLKASQAGEFSNGITTIQCMYAPEFSSHSEGIRVRIS
jgi:uncharacterized protein YfaS (alpha-2-macroglobulin family)